MIVPKLTIDELSDLSINLFAFYCLFFHCRRQIDRAFSQGSFATNNSSSTTSSSSSSSSLGKTYQSATYTSEYKFPGFYSHWDNYNHCYYSQTGIQINGAGDSKQVSLSQLESFCYAHAPLATPVQKECELCMGRGR